MTCPAYPTNPGNWPALREQLLTLEVETLAQDRQVITLLARELSARWYVSVMRADYRTNFTFTDISAGENPITSWRPYLGPGGMKTRGYYKHYGKPNSVAYGGGGRRISTIPHEHDEYVDNIPAPPRDPAIWSAVVADVSAQAEALIEELS